MKVVGFGGVGGCGGGDSGGGDDDYGGGDDGGWGFGQEKSHNNHYHYQHQKYDDQAYKKINASLSPLKQPSPPPLSHHPFQYYTSITTSLSILYHHYNMLYNLTIITTTIHYTYTNHL